MTIERFVVYRDISEMKAMLLEPQWIDVRAYGLAPLKDIHFNDFSLLAAGILEIRKPFCWDLASGPTVDTPDSVWASCVHDVLCKLMELGVVPQDKTDEINQLFFDICIDCGMDEERAKVWKLGVDIGVPLICQPDGLPEYEILTAPRGKL